MRELWRAFVARVVYWLTPKPPVPAVVQVSEPPLAYGECVCSHGRNFHRDGKGSCSVALNEPDGKHNDFWGECACQVFILDEDDDDDPEPEPETPSPSELERLYQR